MPLLQETIQSLTPGDIIELFELDLTPITQRQVPEDHYYFHAGTNIKGESVVWQGITYSPFPVEATGFEMTTKGTMPRPSLRAANVTGILTALMSGKDGLIGAKVIRRCTLAQYLDAVNFPGNVNPSADPTQAFPDEVFFIERKVQENKEAVEWELASSLDMSGAMIPARIITATYCPWQYRGAECGYTGTNYYDERDIAVGSLAADVCGKRIESCKLRFGASADLPFGGFPASRMYRL